MKGFFLGTSLGGFLPPTVIPWPDCCLVLIAGRLKAEGEKEHLEADVHFMLSEMLSRGVASRLGASYVSTQASISQGQK